MHYIAIQLQGQFTLDAQTEQQSTAIQARAQNYLSKTELYASIWESVFTL